ncbi:MAG: cyclic nucleotide-binding domain-containing protein [Verrucomicrobia bacterium]|nr:cyclic nucleotide-binding domain-containing protein [Verrucomicrobiota bacterium]
MREEIALSGDFTEEEWRSLKSMMQEIQLDSGAVLFEEGTEETDLYLLEEGRLEVSKRGFFIAMFRPGDWVGEMAALVGDKKRTATVKAKEKSVLLKLSLSQLYASTKDNPEIHTKLIMSLSKRMADRLSVSTDSRIQSIQKQLDLARNKIVMAEFLCDVLFGLAAFFYALKIIGLMNFNPRVSTAMSIPLIMLLSYFLLMFIKNSGYPLRAFGLTLNNWKRSVVESVLCTIPLIFLSLVIKWALISTLSIYEDVPLMHFHSLLKRGHLDTIDWLLITVGYALFVPVQALMVNGCMQSAFTKFFVGPRRNFLAIVLSSLIFSTLHLQLSLSLAIFVFFVGCAWGWLYSRHQTILGISISHIIIGIWGGVFMGLP